MLFAVAALAIALLVANYFLATRAVHARVLHTSILPTHTVFTSDSIVLAQRHSEDILFVAATLHLENSLPVPISLDDYTLTLSTPGQADLTARAVPHQDLPNLELSFPALKPLVPVPLHRDIVIAPAQAAEGTLVFSLAIPGSAWDARTSAVLHILPHNQPALALTLAKP